MNNNFLLYIKSCFALSHARWLSLLFIFCFAIIILCLLYGLKNSIGFYRTIDDLTPQDYYSTSDFRILGYVAEPISQQSKEDLDIVSFNLTNGTKNIPVYYKGRLPLLFKKGQAVILEGQFKQIDNLTPPEWVFIARHLLTKHDENYHPASCQFSKG